MHQTSGKTGSVIALIIMAIVGPMIKRESPGPILFVQERIGRNGKLFKMYKIRSMHIDAEERKQQLMNQNRVKDGMMFKLDFDPRIIGNEILPDGTKKTGIGEFIRRFSVYCEVSCQLLERVPQQLTNTSGTNIITGPGWQSNPA